MGVIAPRVGHMGLFVGFVENVGEVMLIVATDLYDAGSRH